MTREKVSLKVAAAPALGLALVLNSAPLCKACVHAREGERGRGG